MDDIERIDGLPLGRGIGTYLSTHFCISLRRAPKTFTQCTLRRAGNYQEWDRRCLSRTHNDSCEHHCSKNQINKTPIKLSTFSLFHCGGMLCSQEPCFHVNCAANRMRDVYDSNNSTSILRMPGSLLSPRDTYTFMLLHSQNLVAIETVWSEA